jgi:hypothetical protein
LREKRQATKMAVFQEAFREPVVMRMQLCTWPEVEAYLKRSTGIIMPLGSTEQHGPNGFIGTDALCPELLAGAMAETLDVMIAPTINVGMAQHHLGFPGSMALRPTTLIAVVRDMVKSLALHGFDRFFSLTATAATSRPCTRRSPRFMRKKVFAIPAETILRCAASCSTGGELKACSKSLMKNSASPKAVTRRHPRWH